MKTSALTKWLVTTATTALLAYLGWCGLSLVSQGAAIAAGASDRAAIIERLDRIENKVDRILRHDR